jgi:hypothetical protein
MASSISVFCKVDSSALNAAIRWRRDVLTSKRTMREIVCTAALEVAMGASAYMPYVQQSTIDSELNVSITPRLGRGGKPRYTRATRIFHGNKGTARFYPAVPLAALIVNARSNYQSFYNMSTHHRYYRQASPFAGVSRAAGRAAMIATVNRMIRQRHSSTHFLQSGWQPAIRQLAPFSVNRGRALMSLPKMGRSSAWHNDRGSALVNDTGTSTTVTIENAIGMIGPNAANFNEALWRHGAPALQRALNDEAQSMIEYIEARLTRDNAKASAMMR